MELTNDFEVNVPIDQAWDVLTDIERIAPCLPGAQLQEVEGDEYRGIVKVKVGPISAQYKGTARMIEKDDAAHKAVLKADGRDTRGQGNANAVITATLESSEGGTKVNVHTDLTVTGKVAQFGRGVLADVSARLLDQFVENLETTVLGDDSPEATEEETSSAGATTAGASAPSDPATAPASPPVDSPPSDSGPATAPASPPVDAGSPAASGLRRIDHKATEPVNLLETAGGPVAKRVLPAIGVIVILFLLWRWLNGRSNR